MKKPAKPLTPVEQQQLADQLELGVSIGRARVRVLRNFREALVGASFAASSKLIPRSITEPGGLDPVALARRFETLRTDYMSTSAVSLGYSTGPRFWLGVGRALAADAQPRIEREYLDRSDAHIRATVENVYSAILSEDPFLQLGPETTPGARYVDLYGPTIPKDLEQRRALMANTVDAAVASDIPFEVWVKETYGPAFDMGLVKVDGIPEGMVEAGMRLGIRRIRSELLIEPPVRQPALGRLRKPLPGGGSPRMLPWRNGIQGSPSAVAAPSESVIEGLVERSAEIRLAFQQDKVADLLESSWDSYFATAEGQALLRDPHLDVATHGSPERAVQAFDFAQILEAQIATLESDNGSLA